MRMIKTKCLVLFLLTIAFLSSCSNYGIYSTYPKNSRYSISTSEVEYREGKSGWPIPYSGVEESLHSNGLRYYAQYKNFDTIYVYYNYECDTFNQIKNGKPIGKWYSYNSDIDFLYVREIGSKSYWINKGEDIQYKTFDSFVTINHNDTICQTLLTKSGFIPDSNAFIQRVDFDDKRRIRAIEFNNQYNSNQKFTYGYDKRLRIVSFKLDTPIFNKPQITDSSSIGYAIIDNYKNIEWLIYNKEGEIVYNSENEKGIEFATNWKAVKRALKRSDFNCRKKEVINADYNHTMQYIFSNKRFWFE